MAGKNYPVTFILGLTDLASAKFTDASEKMRKQAKRIEKIKDPNEKAHAQMLAARERALAKADRFTSIGKKLTVGLTLPIVGMGVASEMASARFESSMANVSTLIDSNVENIDTMGNRVLEIGKRTPVALDQLTGALYDIRSAGVAADDQFRVLEGSARLAVAGLGTVQESTDLVTSAMNAFQLKGEEADKIYNSIFATVKFGKTTISGLAQGFGGVAATVAASGTSFDEYLSMVAALTTTGQPAAQAHTQLKAVLSGLTHVSKETSTVFKQLGAKDLPDLIAKSNGLTPALQAIVSATGVGPKFTAAIQKAGAKDFPDLVEKAGGVEEALASLGADGQADAGKLLKLVGSTEALNAVMSLTGPVAQVQADALDKMRNSSGLLDEAFAKQDATRNARMQRAKNSMESAGIIIGERLAPHVERLAGLLADLADGFGQLSDTKQSLTLWGGAVLATMGPVLSALGNALRIMNALKAVGGATAAAGAAGEAGAGAAAGAAVGAGIAGVAATGALVVAGGVLAYKVATNDPLEGTYGGSNGYRWDPAEKGAGERLHDAMANADKAKIDAALFGGAPWAAPSDTTIKVDFANMPKGVNVSADSKGPADVALNLGYSMPPG